MDKKQDQINGSYHGRTQPFVLPSFPLFKSRNNEKIIIGYLT